MKAPITFLACAALLLLAVPSAQAGPVCDQLNDCIWISTPSCDYYGDPLQGPCWDHGRDGLCLVFAEWDYGWECYPIAL